RARIVAAAPADGYGARPDPEDTARAAPAVRYGSRGIAARFRAGAPGAPWPLPAPALRANAECRCFRAADACRPPGHGDGGRTRLGRVRAAATAAGSPPAPPQVRRRRPVGPLARARTASA